MSRASRAPLVAGLIAVVAAAVGLATLLWATWAGLDKARVEPFLEARVRAGALFMTLAGGPFALGLLVAAGLVLARRPAGRSALVWLTSTGTVLVVVLGGNHYALLRPADYDVWVGSSPWIGGLALAAALAALPAAAICLGIPATRRAVAGTPPPAEAAPGPLRRSPWWLAAGGALGGPAVAGAITQGNLVTEAAFIVAVVAGVPLVAGSLWAAVTAAIAIPGRPVAAHLARAGGAVALVGHWMALFQTADTASAGLAPLPGSAAVPVAAGLVVLAVEVCAVVATVAGLTGLADPRTERYLKRPAPAAGRWENWGTWTAAGPGPALVHAPASEAPPEPSRVNGWSAP